MRLFIVPQTVVAERPITFSWPRYNFVLIFRLSTSSIKQEGEALRAGIVYIALPQQHLLVNPNGTFSLSQVAFVDFLPPSADLLLQSVAASFKERAIAVILTGTGSDGTLGVQAIQKMGGKVIAQDESTSEFFQMPSSAIQTGKVDFVLPISAIASTLVNLVMADSAV